MPSRREFLHAGLAASIVPVAMPMAAAARYPSGTTLAAPIVHALYTVVCDVRSPESVALALEVKRAGVGVTRISGDITDFWFHDLSLRWKKGPVAVAGLTADGPLFCLERLAWDHGMRVVLRGTHQLSEAGDAEHSLSGPAGTIAGAATADLGGPDWARAVARLLMSCEARRDSSSITLAGAASIGGRPRARETLMSWVIAPGHQG